MSESPTQFTTDQSVQDLTYESMLEAVNQLKSIQTDYLKDVFSCFEGANLNDGDSVVMSSWLANQLNIENGMFQQLSVSPHLTDRQYLIISKIREKRRPEWISETFFAIPSRNQLINPLIV